MSQLSKIVMTKMQVCEALSHYMNTVVLKDKVKVTDVVHGDNTFTITLKDIDLAGGGSNVHRTDNPGPVRVVYQYTPDVSEHNGL